MDHLRNLKERVNDHMTEGRGEYPDPPGKGGQMQCGFTQEDEAEKADFIHTLKFDLANTYYWSGNIIKDYFFFVCNWHPLLGILLSHPYHPWGKRERLQMTLISLFLTMPASVAIVKRVDEVNFGPSYTSWRTIMTIIFVTIPDTIIGVVLYQLSIADTRCPACASCMDALNKVCMNCFLFIGLVSSAICYLLISTANRHIHWVEAFTPLFMGKAYSFAIWFPMWLILPCVGFLHEWYMENKALKKEQEQGNSNNALQE